MVNILCLAAAAILAAISPAAAQQAGDRTVSLGLANVNPKSGNCA